ncbi:MAG: chromosomal replication initiator protein DnaA [Rhodothermales bacterium]
MHPSPESAWNSCLEIIRDNVPRLSFKTWFEPIRPLRLEDEAGGPKLTVELPSRFYFEWLEEHYFGLLRKTVTKVLGPQGRLFYDVVIEKQDEDGGDSASMHVPARQPAAPARDTNQRLPSAETQNRVQANTGSLTNPFIIPGIRRAPIDSQLNGSYVFERFIEGDCNRLARSAAWAIAQQPGATSFNPFLIYGGVGLGKTHLIQAIGNYVRQHRKTDSVLYVSSERFTTEFVQSIQHNRVSDFSLFYRQIDLLIVDDIQFFGGKEKTQEEFFHIFNALHQAGKQIVLSGDRPPRDIQGIEERLLSRFQWGLSADVQPPELETRIAILQRKAEDDGIDLDQEIIDFIAHNIKSNIRELEGALIRLLAHATLHKRDIDLPLAREVLRDLVKDARVSLNIEEIQRITCKFFNISDDLVRAKTRKREVVQARQVAMYFCKEFTQHSLKTIGLHFGGRDHSTVIHAIQSIENQMETTPTFADTIAEIRRKIELQSR